MKNFFKSNEHRISIITLGLLGLIAFWYGLNKAEMKGAKDPNADETINENSTIDTLIPAGFVLVPIELINAEPLSSLVGATAVVDLYQGTQDLGKKGRRVGSRLKLVRAPKNPNLYAVLVSEKQSEQILAQPGPFFAVIQNHQETGSTVKVPHKSAFEISYQR